MEKGHLVYWELIDIMNSTITVDDINGAIDAEESSKKIGQFMCDMGVELYIMGQLPTNNMHLLLEMVRSQMLVRGFTHEQIDISIAKLNN